MNTNHPQVLLSDVQNPAKMEPEHELKSKMLVESKAAPLPAMPYELMQSRLELLVPVSFYVR